MNKKEQIVFRKGKKIILRPICESDIDKCIVWMNDPDVTQFVAQRFPMFLEDEKEWVREARKNKENSLRFAIETLDGTYIGNTGLHPRWTDGTADFGIMIGEKDYWGKGYGADVIMTLLEYAFYSLNLRKISLTVFATNPRAHKCYQKCGFEDEGCKRQQYYVNGKYVDEIIMGCFREDWEKIWEEYQKQLTKKEGEI